MRLLSDVTVVETGSTLALGFAGRVLQLLGASVTRMEAAGGDPLGAAPEGTVQHALYQYLHEGKRIIRGSGEIARLLVHAHVWLDARPPAVISEDPFSLLHRDGKARPDLTHVAITPFGLDGPWRDHPASPMVALAVGGFLYLCGEADREPLRNGGHLPDFQTGLFAALGAVAGLVAVGRGRPGRLVDLSLLESVVAFHERGDLAVTHLGADIVRSRRHEGTHPFTILPCSDGFVSLAVGTPRQWENLSVLIGKPEWGGDSEFLLNRLAHWQEIDEYLLPWLAERTADEVTKECQELFIACGPVLSATEVLGNAHLAERDFFRRTSVPGGEIKVPGLPIRIGGRPLDPAPEGAG
ncbi:MAG: CoA transferase [Chloroflexi bacterium]|nr:CoA transferase [Chloroflexota bacterium]